MRKYKIGQRITIPKLDYVCPNKRNAVVIAEYPDFYLVFTEAGYRECISKYVADEYNCDD